MHRDCMRLELKKLAGPFIGNDVGLLGLVAREISFLLPTLVLSLLHHASQVCTTYTIYIYATAIHRNP